MSDVPNPPKRSRPLMRYSKALWLKFRFMAFAIIVLLAVRSSLADWNDVPSGSMKPTILEGDRIFVNKLAYDLKVPFTMERLFSWGDPKRGDVVVFFSPADGIRLVKRVVGVPGDTVELRENCLVINGEPAAYASVSTEQMNAISPVERLEHGLLLEREPAGPSHEVMSTPGIFARRNFEPLTLGPGKYFMMGDNRDNSKDSRYFGPVDRGQIVGHAVGIAMSLDIKANWKPRWERFFSALR